MQQLDLNKAIQAVKDAKEIIQPNRGVMQVEYFIYVNHVKGDMPLVIKVDSKGTYLTFDGAKISKPKLQKILNEIKLQKF
jgi:hypothetical protein